MPKAFSLVTYDRGEQLYRECLQGSYDASNLLRVAVYVVMVDDSQRGKIVVQREFCSSIVMEMCDCGYQKSVAGISGVFCGRIAPRICAWFCTPF